MTQTANNLEVVGRAVYLEFTKIGMTTQVIIMPEGMSTSHRTVPMTMLRRKLSNARPRKTWTVTSSPVTSSLLTAKYSPVASAGVSIETRSLVAGEMLKLVTPLLDNIMLNGWQLYKEPIVIEATAEDLELVRQGKTPYKTIGRINKVRKAMGFPKEIIHPIAGTV